MNKRNLMLGLVVLLIISAGIWGVLKLRTLTSLRAGSASPPSGSSDKTSLSITGTLVIPTIKVSTSTINCDPKHVPGVGSDSAHDTGVPAIKPHLCSIPTFTEQDVRQYMHTVTGFTGMRIRQVSPDYRITRILFITNEVANDPNGLNADTGVGDPNLIVCYVEVYGTFYVDGGPPRLPETTPLPHPLLHRGQMVFDGVTGNLLLMGVTQ